MENLLYKLKIAFIPCEDNEFSPRFLKGRLLFYCFVFVLILKLSASSFLVYFPESVFFADITKIALIQLANEERTSFDIGSLKEDEKLNEAAMLKAKDMLAKDYFAHFSPEGTSPWHWFEQAGYEYKSAGENLAIGFIDSEEVHEAWLNSESHRKNLLDSNYEEIGIAVLKGDFNDREAMVVVQLFGTPKEELVVKTESLAGGSEIIKEEPTKENIKETEVIQEEIIIEEENVSEEPVESVAGESLEVNLEKEPATGLLSFLVLDYYGITQIIIYGFLVFIIISLILDVFIKFDIQDKAVILKTCAFIVLLIIFVLIDKGTLIGFIPHELNIY